MNGKLFITKVFEFDSAHELPNYDGPCANLHGHRWVLEVTVSGEINKQTGMIMDFTYLKAFVQNEVIKFLDHNFINNEIPNPTAEMMIMWMLPYLETIESKGVRLERVKLYETPTGCCEFVRE